MQGQGTSKGAEASPWAFSWGLLACGSRLGVSGTHVARSKSMATVATHDAPSFSMQSRGSLLSSEVMVRFALVPLAVAICYCFHWRLLRFLTPEVNMRLDWLAGIHLQRLTFDTVVWKGVLLLWDLPRSVSGNLAFAELAEGFFAFNVVRLSLSDVLFAAGLPWDLAHNVISGLAYFVVWVWIWRRRPFSASIQPSLG
jgi:hypothetical protein